jgi:hypothetical protein
MRLQMGKVLPRLKSQNFINLISICYLSLIFLPFSREPIQADDLTGYSTVIQINGDLGPLEGYKRWIVLQFQMSSHFNPTGWSFQWVQFTTVDFLSKLTQGNFALIWITVSLSILVVLTFWSIRNIVFGLSRFVGIDNFRVIEFKSAFIIMIFGANITIHSPWSIDPFASHLAFGLLTTFFFSLIFKVSIEILKNTDQNLNGKLKLKYFTVATLGLMTYDLFISLLFVSTIILLVYSKIVLVSTVKKIYEFYFFSIFGLIYPVGFFVLSRIINQVPEYDGTKLLVNAQSIKATFVGIVSTFQPVGTLKAIRVYNQPITLHISAILVSFALVFLFLYFTDLAKRHKVITSDRGYSKEIIFYSTFISFTVVGTQVFNERWGEHIITLGNVYLFYSTTLILGVCTIGFITYDIFFTTRERLIHLGMYPLIIILLVTSTATNWSVLKRDNRTPGTDLIALAYDTSSLEFERCEAEERFRQIGYPDGYSSIVISAVKSFGARNLGENFCRESEVRE